MSVENKAKKKLAIPLKKYGSAVIKNNEDEKIDGIGPK